MKPKPSLQFVSGLPRSGSTLLLNLLGQNPNHYVTATSDVIEIYGLIQAAWPNQQSFKSWGLEFVKPFARNGMRGWLEGFYSQQFDHGMVVFDKSRAWIQRVEELEKVLDRKIKVIVTIRDIRSILASFEKLYRKRDIDYRYNLGELLAKTQTVKDRCEVLLQDDQVIGLAINRVRDALKRCKEKLHVVPYGALCDDPLGELRKIHKALGLKPFKLYKPNKVKQITKEDDTFHGLDLHRVRPKVKPADESDWQRILDKDYAEDILHRYFDIEVLAQSHNK